jgi:hypothetical protein
MGRGVGKGTKGKGKIPPYPLLQSLDRRRPLLQLCAFSLFPFPFSLPEGFCSMPHTYAILLIRSQLR